MLAERLILLCFNEEACYTLVFNGPKEEGLHASQPLLDSIADAMDKDVACRIPPRCYLRLIDAPSEHLMFIRQNIKSGEPFIQVLFEI